MSRRDHDRAGSGADLALAGLIAAAMLVLTVLGGILMIGAGLTAGLLGGPWRGPGMSRWAVSVAAVLAHPDEPGAALGPPWSQLLAGHAGLYWTVTTLLAAGTAAVLTVAGRMLWRRFAPAAAGHASRADIRAELSPHHARRAAAWTRPGLTAQQRRAAPVEEIAVQVHRGPHGERLCVPLENPTGVIAPTRIGKTRTDTVHKVLAAPGMLLCSTTKPDLFEFTALARSRMPDAGPVLVFDTTGTVTWPAQVRWSPIHGCTDPAAALRRAEALVDAASLGLEHIGGNDKVFRGRAKTVMQAYLLAAALGHHTVSALVDWAVAKPPDREPVELLRQHGHQQIAANLAAEIGMVAETSDAVWLTVRRVIEPWLHPALRELSTPTAGQEFDAEAFVVSRGSLFVVSDEHHAADARPLLTALADHLITTQQQLALAQPTRRLDPPATNVLEELYDATPIPRLPGIIADSAGRGVLIHWAAQSLAQLEELYRSPGQRQLLDNTLTVTIFGALKDPRALEWVSTIAGQHDRRRYQHHTSGLLGAGRSSVGVETVPTYRAGAVRTLDSGRVLLIHRNLKPILARTLDVAHRPDWAQLQADIHAIRTGQIPISPTGHNTEPATAAPAARHRWWRR